MEFEAINFELGLNLKKSPLLLKDGELVLCEGFGFNYEGVMTARESMQAVNVGTVGSIHSLHRYINHLLVGDDGVLRYKWDLNGYCDLYTPESENFTYLGSLASANKWRVADYAGFGFIATENDLYVFCNGFYFNCGSIKAPDEKPNVTSSGGTGTPADHTWYYTYVYRFKNGHTYETGLSPGTVVSANPTGATATITARNSTIYPMSVLNVSGGGNDSFTKLLLHMYGSDGATTFTDSSSSGHSFSRNGDAQIDTAQSVFGGSSLVLDGTGDDINTSLDADFAFGSGDFTIDFRVRFAANSGSMTFFDFHNDGSNYIFLSVDHSADLLSFRNAVAGVAKASYDVSWNPSVNIWYHIAIVRSGTTFKVFIDGVSQTLIVNTAIGTNDIGVNSGGATNTAYIGSYITLNRLNGWIDEFRISKGTARWTSNFAVPTSEYSSTSVDQISAIGGLDVFWKAYKTADLIGGVYQCYDGVDKYSLSATDTYTDANVIDNPICTTIGYGSWPTGIKDICVHLQRLFGIKENKLYFSEPYLPFAVDPSNYISITSDGVDLEALSLWGDNLFIASKSTWFRINGNTSSTWSIGNTFSEVGTINRHTAKITLQGIVSLWYDGIYLFDGYRSRNVTDAEIGKKFFSDISDKSACFSEFHNNKYYFMYPSTGSVCDKCLMVDFTAYPDLKFYHSNFVPSAFEYHIPTGIKYFGKTDGYQYEEGGSEVIATSLQTGDRAMKNVFKRKQLQYLMYDVNTSGKDLTVSIYVDGVNSYSFTLNESSRVRSRQLLPKLEGYRFSVYLSCADSSGLLVYEPWGLYHTFVGE